MKTTQKAKWKWLAPLGLTLIGAGVSITGEATLLKGAAYPSWQWIGLGTVGLIVLNAGIAVFGEAVKYSTLETWRKENQSSH